MKAYSFDLRERVAAACAQPGRTVPLVAAQFSVSVSFVEKLLHRQRTTGSVAALPPRSGPAPDLDARARAELRACLHQQPDATLAELCTWLAALGGPAVSQSTLWRAVQALDWRRKKRVSTPPSATPSG
ncbi:helix-turn-helix domain-containing protein [Hymenobacter rubidus]|uniref:helix-turn-helix domain-containing protein n=1 Tax=Hymenobacter rubidus TaxID=1441626 RepID=UPI00191E7DE5|nr:transposase [Hymenobacter rubidus]